MILWAVLGAGCTVQSEADVFVTTATGGGAPGLQTIAAGSYHACALMADTTVRCWGKNDWGQLGDGTWTDRHNAVTVAGLTGAIAIGASGAVTCALIGDGTVRCWGEDSDCALGADATTTTPNDVVGLGANASPVPVAVPGIDHAVRLVVGAGSSCVLRDDGTVACWGRGGSGGLDDGTTRLIAMNCPASVATIPGLAGAVSIAAGGGNVCAVLTDGSVACWQDHVNAPVRIAGISHAVAVTLGASQSGGLPGPTCALLDDATVQCWGDNHSGQLGNGLLTDSTAPVTVPGLAGVTQIVARHSHMCAVLGDGSARCWGVRYYVTPDQQMSLGPASCGEGSWQPCSLSPLAVDGLTDVTQLALGEEAMCALLADGNLQCLGANTFGQLGDGTTDGRLTPAPVVW